MVASGTATGTAQIGVTGLAVMGRNLARNFARNGYTVAIHNRSYAKTESLVADHGEQDATRRGHRALFQDGDRWQVRVGPDRLDLRARDHGSPLRRRRRE